MVGFMHRSLNVIFQLRVKIRGLRDPGAGDVANWASNARPTSPMNIAARVFDSDRGRWGTIEKVGGTPGPRWIRKKNG
jgi:hypothetical protein